MRTFFRLLSWALLLAPLLLLLSFWLVLSPEPLVAGQPPLGKDDLLRARGLLAQHRAQSHPHDAVRALRLSARDLEIGARLLLERQLRLDGGVRVRIPGDRLEAEASIRIPGLPVRRYLNLALHLREQGREPVLVRLRVGPWEVPRAIGRRLLAAALAWADGTREYRAARRIVDEIRLTDGRLELRYRWTPELAAEAWRTLGAGPGEAEQAYLTRLRTLLHAQPGSEHRLAALLPPLFALAAERAPAGPGVLDEHRRLLGVLGAWAAPRRAARLLGFAPGTLPRFHARLHGREDLARHFLISASLSARASDALANTAGVYKELSDADGGSGFSFADLAADRAGTRFGTLATADVPGALRLRTRLRRPLRDTDLMPAIDALAEGLDMREFERGYRDLDSPRYRAAVREIDRRIGSSPLYGTP